MEDAYGNVAYGQWREAQLQLRGTAPPEFDALSEEEQFIWDVAADAAIVAFAGDHSMPIVGMEIVCGCPSEGGPHPHCAS